MAPRVVPSAGGCLVRGAVLSGIVKLAVPVGRHKDCDLVVAGGGPGGGGGRGIPCSHRGALGEPFDGLKDEDAVASAPVEAALREAGGLKVGSILSGSNACTVCCCRVSIALAGDAELLLPLPLKEIAESIRSAWFLDDERIRLPEGGGGGKDDNPTTGELE